MSSPIRRLFFLSLLFFIFSTLMRLAFYFAFRSGGGEYTSHELWQAFITGARFDIRVSLVYTLPLALLGWIPPFNPDRSASASRFWRIFYLIFTAILILFFFFDFGHFSYLQGRINVTILLFLQNPLISGQMLWESYNVPLHVATYLAIVYGIYIFIKRHVFIETPTVPTVKKPLFHKIAKVVIAIVVYIGFLHGSFGQYPLRWSDAFFANNSFITALTMNPIHYFFDTFENPERDFDENRARAAYPVMAKYLGIQEPDAEKLSYARPIEQTPRFRSRPNIVYIVMESMAAYKTGLFGNHPEASPALDQLAQNGWLFTNFYTPTEGTARSLFCVLTSLPDINAKSTSSRNPMIIDQNSIFNSFKDYEKMYFIGGSAAWGNIRGVYKNNIPGLRFYEDKNLQGPRTDVWGLSDLDLFREAARILKNERDESKPFVAVIQTAGFHRPYTIPKDHGDFTKAELKPEELKKYGWSSNEEFNSMRFQDYSLGEFIRLIKNEKYFENTIFVIHGDHGLPNRGAEILNEGYRQLELNRFHVPLVIYSPLIEKSEKFNMMATEMDVLPTLAGITGHTFTNTSLGRNLFALDATAPRYAWSYVYYDTPLTLFLYDQEFIVRGTPDGAQGLYQYTGPTPNEDVKEKFPEKFKEMSELLTGFYETGKWMIFHNKASQGDK